MTRANADNLFGITDYIVSNNASQGSFTIIQDAINACALAGGGLVVIKPGTYNESLTLAIGVDILGVDDDGRGTPLVNIFGNHSFTGDSTSGMSGFVIQNVNLGNGVGNTFTLTCNGPNGFFCAVKNCNINSPTGGAFVLDSTSTGGVTALLLSSNGNSNNTFATVGNFCGIQLDDSSIYSATGAGAVLNGTNSSFTSTTNATVSAQTNAVIFNNSSAQARVEFSDLHSGQEIYNFTVDGGNLTSYHNVLGTDTGSGNYIVGTAPGTSHYSYASEVLSGSAKKIGPNIFEQPQIIRPLATAGTPLTAVTGTASFDSSSFTVTDGFVEVIPPVNPVLTTSVTLTSQQVKNLIAAPIQIIPAPGAGKCITGITAVAKLVYGGTSPFTNPQNIGLNLANASGASVVLNFNGSGWIDQSATTYQVTNCGGIAGTTTDAANFENQNVVITNLGISDITGNAANDNTVVISVTYQILTL